MSKITIIGQGECEFDGQFSLLDAIDEAGFDAPYSCRGGHCGACEAKLVSGQVELIQDPSYEPDKGHVLACSVIPVGDVEIEIL